MLPPCPIHGMRGGIKTSCDGLANKARTFASIYLSIKSRNSQAGSIETL